MVELVAAQGGGALVRRLVEVAGSAGAPAELCESALYDCAVVVFNLAGAAASCAALQRDLVGEGGVFPALATLAGVRYIGIISIRMVPVHTRLITYRTTTVGLYGTSAH